jgi:hypothetical protein
MNSSLVNSIVHIIGFLLVFETLNAVLLFLFPHNNGQTTRARRGRNRVNAGGLKTRPENKN